MKKTLFVFSMIAVAVLLVIFGCTSPKDTISITSLTANPNPVAVGDTSTITAAVDYEGDVSYLWSWEDTTISGVESAIAWIAPSDTGSYTINLHVSAGDASDDGSVVVRVVNTLQIVSLVANPSSVGPSETSNITANIYYTGTGTVNYNWSYTGGTISGTGDSVNWTAPAITGTYTVTLIATDGAIADTASVAMAVAYYETIDDFEDCSAADWWEFHGGGATHIYGISDTAHGGSCALRYEYTCPSGGWCGIGEAISPPSDTSLVDGVELWVYGDAVQIRIELEDDNGTMQKQITPSDTGWILIRTPFSGFVPHTGGSAGDGILYPDRIQTFKIEPNTGSGHHRLFVDDIRYYGGI